MATHIETLKNEPATSENVEKSVIWLSKILGYATDQYTWVIHYFSGEQDGVPLLLRLLEVTNYKVKIPLLRIILNITYLFDQKSNTKLALKLLKPDEEYIFLTYLQNQFKIVTNSDEHFCFVDLYDEENDIEERDNEVIGLLLKISFNIVRESHRITQYNSVLLYLLNAGLDHVKDIILRYISLLCQYNTYQLTKQFFEFFSVTVDYSQDPLELYYTLRSLYYMSRESYKEKTLKNAVKMLTADSNEVSMMVKKKRDESTFVKKTHALLESIVENNSSILAMSQQQDGDDREYLKQLNSTSLLAKNKVVEEPSSSDDDDEVEEEETREEVEERLYEESLPHPIEDDDRLDDDPISFLDSQALQDLLDNPELILILIERIKEAPKTDLRENRDVEFSLLKQKPHLKFDIHQMIHFTHLYSVGIVMHAVYRSNYDTIRHYLDEGLWDMIKTRLYEANICPYERCMLYHMIGVIGGVSPVVVEKYVFLDDAHMLKFIVNRYKVLYKKRYENMRNRDLLDDMMNIISISLSTCSIDSLKTLLLSDFGQQLPSLLVNHLELLPCTFLVLFILEAIEDIFISNTLKLAEAEKISIIMQEMSNHEHHSVYTRGRRIISLYHQLRTEGQILSITQNRKLKHETYLASKGNVTPNIYCTAQATFVVYKRSIIFACGSNEYGQLSMGHTQPIKELTKCMWNSRSNFIKKIAGGLHHTILITEQGEVYVCGTNKDGQIAAPLWKTEYSVFTKLKLPEKNMEISDVVCGANHTIFLTTFNSIWVCGQNDHGQLGLGHMKDVKVMTKIYRFEGMIKQIHALYEASVCINLDGEVLTTGANGIGQLGNGSFMADAVEFSPTSITNTRAYDDFTLVTGAANVFAWKTNSISLGERMFHSMMDEFCDVQIFCLRKDGSVIAIKVGKIDYIISESQHNNLRDLSLPGKLKTLAEICSLDLATGSLPPLHVEDESKRSPLEGLVWWDRDTVDAVVHYVLEHYGQSHYTFEKVRATLGKVASDFRTYHNANS